MNPLASRLARRTIAAIAVAAIPLGSASTAGAALVVQFGGDASRVNAPIDTAWTNQVGADEVIQWNGVNPNTVDLPNEDPNKFGASGTLVDGVAGSQLTSLDESLVLTTVAVNSNSPGVGFPVLDASGSPNVLGVKSDANEDGAKFNTAGGLSESWTFEFNQPVIVRAMIGAAMNFGGERLGLEVEGEGIVADWNRTTVLVGPAGTTVAPVDFAPTPNRYVLTFPTDANAIEVPAGTDLTISGLQGNLGLHGLVVEVIPEPGSVAALGLVGLLAAGRRSRTEA